MRGPTRPLRCAAACVVAAAGLAALAQTSIGGVPPAGWHLQTCGVERWTVKTLSDPASRRVNFRPKATTVSALRQLRPGYRSIRDRARPVELSTYRVRARLVGMKLEGDGDVHLVVADLAHPAQTLIVEFPQTNCVYRAAPRRKRRMAQARAALVRAN